MIQVFFNHRGSGKSKNLINLANEEASNCKGNLVYIDNSNKRMLQLDSKIRLISLEDFDLFGPEQFYGLLCGIKSRDYDVESIYIDGLCDMLNNLNLDEVKNYFCRLESFSKSMDVNVYITLHGEERNIPEFIKQYVA